MNKYELSNNNQDDDDDYDIDEINIFMNKKKSIVVELFMQVEIFHAIPQIY